MTNIARRHYTNHREQSLYFLNFGLHAIILVGIIYIESFFLISIWQD
jgi:hypothetical protein